MARLRGFNWRVLYSSDEGDLVEDFYVPAMLRSVSYDRGVGYFSSQALALIAPGIQELYLKNGKMRLIASPAISFADREAINSGLQAREACIESRLLEYLDPARLTADESFRLQLLAGMISDGLLEIRIAVKEETDGTLNLYHEKVGVFVDADGDFVTFIGSPNESWNGWVGNAESFALHTSWGPTEAHAQNERGLFDRTWDGMRPRVPVYEFPDAVKNALFDAFPPQAPDGTPRLPRVPRRPPRSPSLPEWLDRGVKLRDYQKEAVNAWLESGGRGIFAMATGTGKTITALVAALQVVEASAESKAPILIVVSVPSKDLVRQWKSNAADFGFEAICCYSETATRWPQDLSASIKQLEYGSPTAEMVIATADTLGTSRFQDRLKTYTGTMMFVADEMHSLGTERRLATLPDARYRLGLSATPRRHGDETGTQSLLNFFGPICMRIDIRDAIDLGALVPYDYHPVLVPLTSDELVKYRELTASIAAAIGTGSLDDLPDRVKFLMLERSRLLGHAEAKLAELERIMKPLADSTHNLVYVAEGAHPLNDTRQIDLAVRLLSSTLGMSVNTYTGETEDEKRIAYQGMLRDGSLQALIAMRCLDEGIDIPEVRRGVILASTQNPRQFVQRRGRILRRDDDGGKKTAELYDLLVVPMDPPPRGDPAYRMERKLVGRELSRALELASAARNGRDTPPQPLVAAMERFELLELIADYAEPAGWEEGESDAY